MFRCFGFFVVSLLSLMAACSPAPPPLDTATPMLMQGVDATSTSQTNPTVSVDTPTPNPNPTAIDAPTADVLISPTPDVIPTVKAAIEPEVIETAESPDGAWQAQVLRYDCVQVGEYDTYQYQELILSASDGGEGEVVASQLLYCGGLGAAGLGQLFWSQDSRTLYYSTAAVGVPDGGCRNWEPPLTALDVGSGEKQELRLGPRSPGGQTIAYDDGDAVVLWSVEDAGTVSRIPLAQKDTYVYSIAWAPDGEALAYLLSPSQCFPLERSALVMVSLPEIEQEIVLETDQPAFDSIDAWEEPGSIRLSAVEGGEGIFDLQSRSLENIATPTP